MEHTAPFERVPQEAARKRQALTVRTGVRAGAEEANPSPMAPTAPSTAEAADTITIKLADFVKMMKCFGSSA